MALCGQSGKRESEKVEKMWYESRAVKFQFQRVAYNLQAVFCIFFVCAHVSVCVRVCVFMVWQNNLPLSIVTTATKTFNNNNDSSSKMLRVCFLFFSFHFSAFSFRFSFFGFYVHFFFGCSKSQSEMHD